jgi:hypothetical protein
VRPQKGVTFKKKSGQQVSLQRADSLSYGTVIAWRGKYRPSLKKHQEKYGPGTLEHVGNFDEFCIDLCAIAHGGFLCLDDGQPANVVTLHERTPHITVLIGFKGRKVLRFLVLAKGVAGYKPHEYNLQVR